MTLICMLSHQVLYDRQLLLASCHRFRLARAASLTTPTWKSELLMQLVNCMLFHYWARRNSYLFAHIVCCFDLTFFVITSCNTAWLFPLIFLFSDLSVLLDASRTTRFDERLTWTRQIWLQRVQRQQHQQMYGQRPHTCFRRRCINIICNGLI